MWDTRDLVHMLTVELDAVQIHNVDDDMLYEFANYCTPNAFMPDMVVWNIDQNDFLWTKNVQYINNGVYYTIETGMLQFVPPHIVVLGTEEPDWEPIEGDRWIVHEYTKEQTPSWELPR